MAKAEKSRGRKPVRQEGNNPAPTEKGGQGQLTIPSDRAEVARALENAADGLTTYQTKPLGTTVPPAREQGRHLHAVNIVCAFGGGFHGALEWLRFHDHASTADSLRESFAELLKWAGEADMAAAQGRMDGVDQALHLTHGAGVAANQLRRVVEIIQQSESPRVADHFGRCTHTADFSDVVWYGTPYHFTDKQRQCVKLLWTEWEKDPQAHFGLHQRTIRDEVGSENADFRLDHTFRQDSKPHPAWGVMIHARGDGTFYLAEPPERRKPKKRFRK